jgi:ferritin-like metal-binding protein YciE
LGTTSGQIKEFDTWDMVFVTIEEDKLDKEKRIDTNLHTKGQAVKDAAVKSQVHQYAEHLEGQAKRFDNYVLWQLGRIKDWKPHPEKLIENKNR